MFVNDNDNDNDDDDVAVIVIVAEDHEWYVNDSTNVQQQQW